jgi:mercuric ion transport protein
MAATAVLAEWGSRAMTNETLLRVGIVGGVVAALCCFTPVLVVGLTAVGLAAALGWLDYVLLPALAAFSMLTGYALWQRKRALSS